MVYLKSYKMKELIQDAKHVCPSCHAFHCMHMHSINNVIIMALFIMSCMHNMIL